MRRISKPFMALFLLLSACGKDGADGARGPAGPAGPVGPQGEKGDKGAQGAQGAQGEEGQTTKITASLHCNGGLEGLSWVKFKYDAMVFSSGDVMAVGSIMDARNEYSNSMFYSSKQVGSNTAAVYVTYDISGGDTYGYWRISLDRSTAITTIQYSDTTYNNTWVMPSSSCLLHNY